MLVYQGATPPRSGLHVVRKRAHDICAEFSDDTYFLAVEGSRMVSCHASGYIRVFDYVQGVRTHEAKVLWLFRLNPGPLVVCTHVCRASWNPWQRLEPLINCLFMNILMVGFLPGCTLRIREYAQLLTFRTMTGS